MAQKQSKIPERITLQYLLKHELPVWVRNNTGDRESGKAPGSVSMQVGSGDTIGKIFIPPGNDPVCITDQVDPASLRSCRDLFLSIQRGGLELLHPDNAEDYYRTNEERRSILDNKIRKYTRGERDAEEGNIPTSAGSTTPMNPKIGDICLRARHKAITERDALERLIEQSKVLTEADYSYVAANGFYPGVKSWAKERLGVANSMDPIDAIVAKG